jgi:hypothetical protein
MARECASTNQRLSSEEFVKKRKEQALPILRALFVWCSLKYPHLLKEGSERHTMINKVRDLAADPEDLKFFRAFWTIGPIECARPLP